MFLLMLIVAAYGQHCHMTGSGHIHNGQFHGQGFTSGQWGNDLAPYWQGRTMAALGGYDYIIYSNMDRDWFKYLPRHVPADLSRRDLAKFNTACAACPTSMHWQYPHHCAVAWSAIGDQIIQDTRYALETWARANNRSLPTFEEDDVVIQQRCAWDVLLTDDKYGPPAFSLYANIPTTTRRIFIVRFAQGVILPACCAIHEALLTFLTERYPHAEIRTISDADRFDDFARFVYAPILFKDSSSFGLAAAMANNGTVWSGAECPGWTFENPHWRWSTGPVMNLRVGREAGLSRDRPYEVAEWLRTH